MSHKLALRQDSVDEAELKRLIGAEGLAKQQKFAALARPKRCGARSEDPASGTRPRLTKGIWKRAAGVA